MDLNALKQKWIEEENYAFSGWDFSHLDGRQVYPELPWDYRMEALNGLMPHHRLLDMDTGGGEFLLTLGHPHANTSVTEAYAPNLALCRERLEPLGVEVIGADGGSLLPFGDGQFDRVINRHGSFLTSELSRILKPGGCFVTQQVGGRNNFDLRRKLGFDVPESNHDLAHNAAWLKEAGFEILRAEETLRPSRFYDAGAVVFLAKIIEWEFPGFSVERCWEPLLEIHREIREKGFYTATEHRFLIVARKKG